MVATLPLTLEIGPRACAPDLEGGRHANFRMLASQIDIERLAIFLPQSGCSRNAESVKVVRPPSEALRKSAPPPIRIGRRLGPMTVVAAVIGVTMAAGALGAVSLTRSMLPAAAATKPDHVVVVIMENHGYSQIIGSSSAPYINSLANANALMTQSFAIGHPSEPNYLELWSGSNQGVTDDSCPHTFSAGSLGQQLISAGKSVVTYNESMPSDGFLGCTGSANGGNYARKHNPGADWVVSQDAAHNKTYNAWPSDFTTLPTVALVVPNLCNDMHDCSIGTGDAWLAAHWQPYVAWAKTHNSLAILTFDEDGGGSNQIYTVFAGAGVTPGQYSEHITHYDVLRTVESFYGLPGIAGAATLSPITDVFGVVTPPSTSPSPTPTPTPTPTP